MHMETKSRRRAPAARIGGAWSQLAATVSAVDASLGKWLGEAYGVGLADYRAILALSKASDRELRITDLAHHVGLNQSSVTRLVGRLEARELAYRDTCPDDGRGVFAVITDRGVELSQEMKAAYDAKVSELLAGLSQQHPEIDPTGVARSFEIVQNAIK